MFAECSKCTAQLGEVMQAGQLVEVGPPAELLQLPQGHFSAMMNALEKAKEGDEGEGKGQ